MTNDPKLEKYLTSLEKALKPFPVSDRAEIVTEIKSHIISALEKDSQARIDSVLSALGEPETVANRYLLERGLKLAKPPISPIVKWVIIGFMGAFAMVLIFAGVVITRFTPLLQVDDSKDKVSILGGLIEIDGQKGSVWIDGSFGDTEQNSFEGSASLPTDHSIAINFRKGKIDLSNSANSEISWSCKTNKSTNNNFNPSNDKSGINLDFSSFNGINCEVSIPEGSHLSIRGTNGKIEINEPHFDLNTELTNGKIELNPDNEHLYRYSLSVTNGKADTFVSSDNPKAHAISIRLTNGKISRAE